VELLSRQMLLTRAFWLLLRNICTYLIEDLIFAKKILGPTFSKWQFTGLISGWPRLLIANVYFNNREGLPLKNEAIMHLLLHEARCHG